MEEVPKSTPGKGTHSSQTGEQPKGEEGPVRSGAESMEVQVERKDMRREEAKGDDQLKEAFRLYGISKIVQAYEIIESISESKCVKSASDSAASQIEEIRQCYRQMVRTRELLADNEGWKCVVDNYNGVSTYHRQEEDTPIHSLKVVGIIEAPIQHILSLIIEADLIPTFINFIKIQLDQLKVKSVYHQILYSRIPLPWPFDHRDLAVEAHGFDVLDEHGEIIIYGATIKEFEDVKIPEVPQRCTRLDLHLGGARIRPLTMNKVEITAIGNLDFKIFLPPTVVNWFAKTFAYYVFCDFRSKAQATSGNGAHYERVKEKKEIYEQVMEPVRAFFLKKNEDGKVDDSVDPESLSAPLPPHLPSKPSPRQSIAN